MRSGLFTVLFGFLFLPLTGLSQKSNPDESILDAIWNSDTISLSEFLNTNPINGLYGPEKHTLLTYAVIQNKPEIISFLISRNADPSQFCHNHSPLHEAVRTNNLKATRILVWGGANVNAKDSLGNTPLILTTTHNSLRIPRFLLKNGAYLNQINNDNYTAINLASLANNHKVLTFLKNRFEKHLPAWSDGPHFRWKSNNKVLAYSLINDSLKRTTKLVKEKITIDSLPVQINLQQYSSTPVWLTKNYLPEKGRIEGVDSIFVAGDIHGDFNNFVKLLMAHRVIDSDLNWNWGNGHMVIMGDILDRGSKVTETLWLVNKLQNQSRKRGGNVHYLLGNHEVMVLSKDLKYIHDKYFYLNDRLNLSYSSHFSKHTELGRWIRSLNTILQLDSFIFVHAGLSPLLVTSKLSVDEVNDQIRSILNKLPGRSIQPSRDWLFGPSGPLWYRGYFDHTGNSGKLSDEEIHKILNYYQVNRIFIGHTSSAEILPLYGGKVIATDIPYYLKKADPKGVMILEGRLYKAEVDGSLNWF